MKKLINKILGLKVSVKGKNNIFDKNIIRKNKIVLKVKGNNNKIDISSTVSTGKLKILIYGDNNHVIIDENTVISGDALFLMGSSYKKTNNSIIHLNKDIRIGSLDIIILEHSSKVIIGEKSLLATEITIRASDGHSIFDEEGKLINRGGVVEIGSNVWIGMDVKIGKGVKIPNNSVIGWGSIVTKSFDEEGIIIAGVPAKVIKRNISWSGESPDSFYEV